MKTLQNMLKKNTYEAKYQLLTNKRENTGLKHFNDSKAFTEYLNDMGNSNKKRKKLIVFYYMIAGIQ